MKSRPKSYRLFVDDCSSVDVLDVGKDQVSAYPPIPSVVLEVTGRFGTKQECGVYLTRTQPHFGGIRLWFLCPRCGRRVRKLLASWDDPNPTCRTCKRAVYLSQWRYPSAIRYRDDD